MKRLNKKSVILAALALLLGGGAYLNYQMSKTDTTGMSDLTLANLEAMAWELDGEMDQGGEFLNGPQVAYDCPGIGTGDGFRCAAQFQTNCSEISCR